MGSGRVALRAVGLHQQVVNADLIEVGQLHQKLIRPLLGAGFQVAVLALGNTEHELRFTYFHVC